MTTPAPASAVRKTTPERSALGVAGLFAGRNVKWGQFTRVAIRAGIDVLNLAPGDEVLVPDYNCGSELDPLIDAGLRLRMYPVGQDTFVDPDQLSKRLGTNTRAIFLIHYFGFIQPYLAEIRALCDANGLRLIEDCAHSLLSGQNPADGRAGDISVFCLYKHFPVIGGGALVLNDLRLDAEWVLDRPPSTTETAKVLLRAAGERFFRGGGRQAKTAKTAHTSGRWIDGGRSDMPAHYYFAPHLRNRRMSRLTTRQIGGLDIAGTIAARRANWQHYAGQLEKTQGAKPLFRELPDDVCPLNYPVLVENSASIARTMREKGNSVWAWWSGFHRKLEWDQAGAGALLKTHVVALPLDQALDERRITRTCDTFRALLA